MKDRKKKKKKKKLTKLQEEYKDVKDIKKHLRQKSEAQGVYGIQRSRFFSSLLEGATGQFILIFVIGWVYVALWMNTPYYDHSFTLINQPNFLIAYLIPWAIVFAFMLYVKPIDMMGKTILAHVIISLIASFFAVGCSIGVMIMGLIIISPLGMLLG